MSNVYSLADLRSDLDREFAPLPLDLGNGTVVLRNLMRVTETERASVLAALADVEALHTSDDTEDVTESSPEDMAKLSAAVELVLTTVAEPGKGDALARALNGDLLLSMKVMELWTASTQPGEAQPSPS